MKFEDVKKWLPLTLIGLPALWLGLYFWAWMAQVGCGDAKLGACLVTALGTWGAKVVMLGWMDTTLGAGFLATLAAGIVIWTTLYQRSIAIADATSARVSARVSAFDTLYACLIIAQGRLYNNDLPGATQAIERTQECITAQAAAFAQLGPIFAFHLAEALTDVRSIKNSIMDEGEDSRHFKLALARLVIIAGYVQPTHSLVNKDGTLNPRLQSPDQVSKLLAALKMELDDVPHSEGLFRPNT